jgi:hypothetical protein
MRLLTGVQMVVCRACAQLFDAMDANKVRQRSPNAFPKIRTQSLVPVANARTTLWVAHGFSCLV